MNWDVIIKGICVCVDVVVPVVSVVASVGIFRATIRRDKKLSTLKIVNEIRRAFPEVQHLSKKETKQYLQRMEFLCTGINEGIYDLSIMRRTSGRLFLSQYGIVKSYIQIRRTKGTLSENTYVEYEQVMHKLDKFYNCKGCWRRKGFCRKCKSQIEKGI